MAPRPGPETIAVRPLLRTFAAVALTAAAVGLSAASAVAQAPAEYADRPQAPASSSPQAPSAGAKKPPAVKPAPPQTSKSWKGRGFAVFTAGAQVAAEGYTSTSTFAVHAEDAALTADASIGMGPVLGARAGMRVWKNLALGGGVELVTSTQSLSVTGRIPHPFFFDTYRDVEGTADGLERVETLVAFEVSWLVAVSRRIDMFVFGGPAYVHVTQDMATGIQFAESYPYDTATYTGLETASVSGGGLGVTGGVDVSYLVSKRLGIGGEVRYTRASTTLTPSSEPSTVPLGGLQVALGARLLF